MNKMSSLEKGGAFLATLAMAYLIIVLIVNHVPLNPATWMLWFTIDFLLIGALIKAGKPYLMMAVFATGTAAIMLISGYNFATGRTPFVWGNGETATVIAAVVAVIVWKRSSNNNIGVVMTTLAMLIAGVPTWIDAYHKPEEADILFWTMSAVACFMTYLGTPKSFYGSFMPIAGVLSNGVIIGLALTRYA
jgi:hypothetical protein